MNRLLASYKSIFLVSVLLLGLHSLEFCPDTAVFAYQYFCCDIFEAALLVDDCADGAESCWVRCLWRILRHIVSEIFFTCFTVARWHRVNEYSLETIVVFHLDTMFWLDEWYCSNCLCVFTYCLFDLYLVCIT